MSEEPTAEREQKLNAILAHYLEALSAGESPDIESVIAQHPDFEAELREFESDRRQFGEDADQLWPMTSTLDAAKLADDAKYSPGPLESSFGDYELLAEIARGGMGVVYRARQVSLNRTVALKMILAGQLASETDVQRFRAEAEAAANLDHPGIVPIYEVGAHHDQHFFSMAFVDGQSLAERIHDGPLPADEAASIVHQIAIAVDHAHQQGVIHRDLKSANVVLDETGKPRITDFGLAKRGDGSELTATGQILGTPSYMPPEQAAGKLDQVAETADIYSIGAVLYATLTGRPPFQAANPLVTLSQVLEEEPVPPRLLNPAVPKDLETICLKCLEKEPHRRYPSATELADDLQRYLNEEPVLGSTDRRLRKSRPLAPEEASQRRQDGDHARSGHVAARIGPRRPSALSRVAFGHAQRSDRWRCAQRGTACRVRR